MPRFNCTRSIRIPRLLGMLALISTSAMAWADGGRWYGGRSDGQWQLIQANTSNSALLPVLGSSRAGAPSEAQSAVRFYGGYQFNELLSIEGAHTSLGLVPDGCFNNSPTSPLQDACLGSALSMAAVSSVPVTANWKMYGRMGVHTWQPGAPSLKLGALTHDGGEYGRVYGLGISYAPADNVTLRMESERYTRILTPGSTVDGNSDAQVQSVSLSVHF